MEPTTRAQEEAAQKDFGVAFYEDEPVKPVENAVTAAAKEKAKQDSDAFSSAWKKDAFEHDESGGHTASAEPVAEREKPAGLGAVMAKSEPSFAEALAEAKSSGKSEFSWNGKTHSAGLSNDRPAAKPAARVAAKHVAKAPTAAPAAPAAAPVAKTEEAPAPVAKPEGKKPFEPGESILAPAGRAIKKAVTSLASTDFLPDDGVKRGDSIAVKAARAVRDTFTPESDKRDSKESILSKAGRAIKSNF